MLYVTKSRQAERIARPFAPGPPRQKLRPGPVITENEDGFALLGSAFISWVAANRAAGALPAHHWSGGLIVLANQKPWTDVCGLQMEHLSQLLSWKVSFSVHHNQIRKLKCYYFIPEISSTHIFTNAAHQPRSLFLYFCTGTSSLMYLVIITTDLHLANGRPKTLWTRL